MANVHFVGSVALDSPEDIHFGELGYAREARPSYEDFLTARSAGQLPEGVRFQVSLPTPWAVVMRFEIGRASCREGCDWSSDVCSSDLENRRGTWRTCIL